jgi:hypothetical protein
MLVLKDLFISLAIISSVVGATHIHKKETCSTPAVRKEWRALTKCEKAAWIKAVNVRVKYMFVMSAFKF